MQLSIDFDKRWDRKRQVWVRPPVVFRSAGYTVDTVHRDRAKDFVLLHHYADSFPSCRLAVGMFNPARELVGVAVFSEPYDHAARCWTGNGTDQVAELGRFVCDPSVAFNGESWFVPRALRMMREEKRVSSIISYADPVARTTDAGDVVKPEHWGTIYQATNALYCGRAESRTQYMAPDGWIVNGRALTKIRKLERGWRYAVEQLVQHGAPTAPAPDDLRPWLDGVLASWRRVRHPGNLTYVFPLTKREARRLRSRALKYEKAAA
jgi:hypothetical protein